MPGSNRFRKVKTGLDILVESQFKDLRGMRVGLLAHAAAVDTQLHSILDLMQESTKVDLRIIFSPEHGFSSAAQDMVAVSSLNLRDSSPGLVPVRSLYGSTADSLIPNADDFSEIDVLVIDLQDIGSRYYTFIQTMSFAMQVAAKTSVKVMVLDRPNPINGQTISGSSLLDSCRSFCGLLPVPQRHGLTIGEAALLYNKGFGEGESRLAPINCDLSIIEMEGWSRELYFDETSLPWVLPSPNMPTLETALVYPGACLFEATNLSEGRGTTKPFEMIGAPFISGKVWADATLHQGIDLSGAILRPVEFEPQFHKWAKQTCGGVQLHISDRGTFDPFRWGLALISSAKELYPENFSWRQDAYEFVQDVPAIDLLFGSPKFREILDFSQTPIANLLHEMGTFEEQYTNNRSLHLLY